MTDFKKLSRRAAALAAIVFREEMTDHEFAARIGWRDIKSWGGRGMRGIAPASDGLGDRHQALPMFTRRLDDAVRAYRGQEGAMDYLLNKVYGYHEAERMLDPMYLCETLLEWRAAFQDGTTYNYAAKRPKDRGNTR